MEDPSVDTSLLERSEVLTRLDLNQSHSEIIKLRIRLKNLLQKDHPIHGYLGQLGKEVLKKLYLIIFEKSGNGQFVQMRKSLANQMFKRFPKAPMTTLIWIEQNGKIPTKIEFDMILKDFYITVTDDNEISPEGDMNFDNKRKQNHDCQLSLQCQIAISRFLIYPSSKGLKMISK